MRGINQVNIGGNVMDDPIIRTLPNGNKVANFRLMIDQSYKTADGTAREAKVIMRCSVFGSALVEKKVEPHIKKGTALLMLNGHLSTNTFTTKTGESVTQIETIFDNSSTIQMVGGRPTDAADASAPAPF